MWTTHLHVNDCARLAHEGIHHLHIKVSTRLIDTSGEQCKTHSLSGAHKRCIYTLPSRPHATSHVNVTCQRHMSTSACDSHMRTSLGRAIENPQEMYRDATCIYPHVIVSALTTESPQAIQSADYLEPTRNVSRGYSDLFTCACQRTQYWEPQRDVNSYRKRWLPRTHKKYIKRLHSHIHVWTSVHSLVRAHKRHR